MNKYDVVIVGGGTSGVAAAYTSAKLGLKTLIVEKAIHLGGTITSALVTPAMKTNDKNINTDFFNNLISFAQKYNAQYTYSDGNKGWFNPELLKIVLDDMLESVSCDILYSTDFECATKNEDSSFTLKLKHRMLSLHIDTNYIVDASADCFVAKNLGCKFLESESLSQTTTLRFIMSNIDMNKFENWITILDTNRNITTSDKSQSEIHLSTAYTWDTNQNWALAPIFAKAIENGDLKEEDSSYFQIFTIPNMPTSITFNCPRIILNHNESINDPEVYSKALIKGRQQIYRISEFCKKYLPGFENAFISNIADMLGIRESNRVEGKYVYMTEDIVNKKDFINPALSSDYPIDIHSQTKNQSKLEFTKGNYYLPIEALMTKEHENLFVIGRCLSASFNAQAALRTQTSCFSMGESIAKHIRNLV